MARDRSDDERDINSLYGCHGAGYESETGTELLHSALNKFGLRAFTDKFLSEVASRHRREDEAMGARAEAEYRRSQRTGLLGS